MITPSVESDELNPFALFLDDSSPVYRLGDDEDEEWDDDDEDEDDEDWDEDDDEDWDEDDEDDDDA